MTVKVYFFVVGAEECEFFLIGRAHSYLVIAGLVVETDKEEAACRISEIVNCIITSGNGVFKRECDLVQATIGNTHAPNELGDVKDMLLVRFGSENNSGSPRPAAKANPAVMKQHLEVLHDNLPFVRTVVGFPATDRG
jgi:hypothetical protein